MGGGDGALSGSRKGTSVFVPRPCRPRRLLDEGVAAHELDLGASELQAGLERGDLGTGPRGLLLELGRAGERAREEHQDAAGHEQPEHQGRGSASLPDPAHEASHRDPSLERRPRPCQTLAGAARLGPRTERMVDLWGDVS